MLGQVLEFVIVTVGLKMIVGHWLATQITKYIKKLFGSTERNTAIWEHYKHQALNAGHRSESVLDCRQDRCAVF